MRAIILSCTPTECEKIVNGDMSILVRKKVPNESNLPIKAYIYETKGATETPWVDEDGHYIYKGKGQVIGEFICDKVYLIKNQGNSFVVANEEQGVTNEIARQSCLDYDDMVSYLGNKDGYGLHITALKIYGEPKKLSEFCIPCKTNCEDCKKPLFYDCWREKGRIKVVTRPPTNYIYVVE